MTQGIDLFPYTHWPNRNQEGPFDTESALRYCMTLAKRHYENFPVAFSLLTMDQQKAAASVYAFARMADDFADEPEFEGIRGPLLDNWQDQLDRCYEGKQGNSPVFTALSWAMARFSLPKPEFVSLLKAFAQDCSKNRYQTVAELNAYCQNSANPIGSLMLRILGVYTEQNRKWSDHLCTALQLANFWQDVSIDAQKNRIYLPAEDLNRFSVSEDDILKSGSSERFRRLMKFEIERTRGILYQGLPLIFSSGMRGFIYVLGVVFGGLSILGVSQYWAKQLNQYQPKLTLRHLLKMGR